MNDDLVLFAGPAVLVALEVARAVHVAQLGDACETLGLASCEGVFARESSKRFRLFSMYSSTLGCPTRVHASAVVRRASAISMSMVHLWICRCMSAAVTTDDWVRTWAASMHARTDQRAFPACAGCRRAPWRARVCAVDWSHRRAGPWWPRWAASPLRRLPSRWRQCAALCAHQVCPSVCEQADRQAGGQAGKQTNRQTDKQTNRQIRTSTSATADPTMHAA